MIALTIALIVVFGLLLGAVNHMHARVLSELERLHAARLDQLVAFQQADSDKRIALAREQEERFTKERREWDLERGRLLNRIKPETKQYVPLTVADVPEMPVPLPYDDDDAYWEDRESREQLAARLMQEELDGSKH